MRRARALVTALFTCGVATVVFAATAAAGGELSKSEYLEEANAICAAANEEIDAAFEEAFAGVESEEDIDPSVVEDLVIQTLVPAIRVGIADIAVLDGPSKVERKVNKALDQYSDAVDEIEDDPLILLDEENDPFEKADKAARKAGLTECAEDEEEEE